MGGGADPVRPEDLGNSNTLAWQQMLGMMSGNSVSPSPDLTGNMVAQQLGGTYDQKGQTIKMPDGSVVRYNPLTNSYEDISGNKSSNIDKFRTADGKTFSSADQLRSYVDNGGRLYRQAGRSLQDATINDVDFGTVDSPYANRANEITGNIKTTVYENPNSPWNNMKRLGQQQYYDAATGNYTPDATGSTNMGSAYYFDNGGGDYLNREYSPYDYEATKVADTENISDAARSNIYQRGADRIATNYRDTAQNTEDFIAQNGGSLSSGRAERLKNRDLEAKNRELLQLQRDTDTEHELRKYNTATRNAELNAGYVDQNQARRAEEARYGFENAASRGRERLSLHEALDAAQRDRAFQEKTANNAGIQAQNENLARLMQIWSGQEANWTNSQIAQQNAIGSAISSLAGGAGAAFGARR